MQAATTHGGRIDWAAAAFPHAPQPWLDLSTGINPCSWHPGEPLSLALDRLPFFSEIAELEAAAAQHFGARPEQVLAVPGSELALRQLGAIGLEGPHRHVAHGYRSHGEAFRESQAVALPTQAFADGTLTLANPDNPSGRLLAVDAVRALAGGGWLIVDEAFADCAPDASIAAELSERTIVLRSFGKFFGLAGVRLGFVIAPEAILTRLRALMGEWPVSGPAIAYGIAAYRDADWIARTRARLIRDAAALDQVLARHGLHPRGACPLFRLVESDRPLFTQLAQAGILTRPFDHDSRWLRIGLPGDSDRLARLDRALADG